MMPDRIQIQIQIQENRTQVVKMPVVCGGVLMQAYMLQHPCAGTGRAAVLGLHPWQGAPPRGADAWQNQGGCNPMDGPRGAAP